MKLLFKQRMFSWFDSYDIYDEAGNEVYSVKGQLSWGHRLQINDAMGAHVGTIQEKIFTFLPKFEMYLGDEYIGCISKEFSFFKPRFNIDCKGWSVEGSWFEWDYEIIDSQGNQIAVITKEIFNWTDTYVLDINRDEDALCVLMMVLAIDAEKCSRDD